jgi:hypothetical protein
LKTSTCTVALLQLAGTVVVHWLALHTKMPPVSPPKLTVPTHPRLEPISVTLVPGGPLVGLIPVSVGSGVVAGEQLPEDDVGAAVEEGEAAACVAIVSVCLLDKGISGTAAIGAFSLAVICSSGVPPPEV